MKWKWYNRGVLQHNIFFNQFMSDREQLMNEQVKNEIEYKCRVQRMHVVNWAKRN